MARAHTKNLLDEGGLRLAVVFAIVSESLGELVFQGGVALRVITMAARMAPECQVPHRTDRRRPTGGEASMNLRVVRGPPPNKAMELTLLGRRGRVASGPAWSV